MPFRCFALLRGEKCRRTGKAKQITNIAAQFNWGKKKKTFKMQFCCQHMIAVCSNEMMIGVGDAETKFRTAQRQFILRSQREKCNVGGSSWEAQNIRMSPYKLCTACYVRPFIIPAWLSLRGGLPLTMFASAWCAIHIPVNTLTLERTAPPSECQPFGKTF